MERRRFLTRTAATVATTAAVAAPAVHAQGTPQIRWRVASSYPRSLDTIYGAMDMAAKRIAELTDGKFHLSVHPAGELVPALGVLDAVQNSTVEAGHTASYFYVGKDPAFGLGTALPFGLNARGQNAWLYTGGGMELLNEFYAQYKLLNFPIGNTGAQMAGWYRKEIKEPADFKGLKFRVGGLAGMALAKLGVVPQQLAPGDLYQALEKGVLDAAEFVGPHDDEKLGLHKVAKYYYYPGWWEGTATLNFFVNQKAWDSLPKSYQAAIRTATAEANQWCTAKYDTSNPLALMRLVQGGAQLRSFSRPVLDASYKATHELFEELSAQSPAFKKMFVEWSKFRDTQTTWQLYCDLPFDSYMASARRKK